MGRSKREGAKDDRRREHGLRGSVRKRRERERKTLKRHVAIMYMLALD
jgi:hypothetical protein